MAVTLQILWTNLTALVSAFLALMPLLWRRAPLGRRLRPARQQARVISLPAGRRASPR